MIEVDLNSCTGDPNTCGVVERIMELDEAAAALQDVDPSTNQYRETFGNFVTACVIGNCPGVDKALANKLTEEMRHYQNRGKSVSVYVCGCKIGAKMRDLVKNCRERGVKRFLILSFSWQLSAAATSKPMSPKSRVTLRG